MSTSCIVAAVQYAFTENLTWPDYEHKIESLLKEAKAHGANVLLLPEYAAMEHASDFAEDALVHFQKIHSLNKQYCEFYSTMAKRYQIYIQPGTLPYLHENYFTNRAYFFTPQGQYYFQDKLYLTKAEKQTGFIVPGKHITVIPTEFGLWGIAICYDVEFPHLVHDMAKEGVTLVLVPSCTDTLQGHYRVHLSCRARALENQIFVANAGTVGDFAGSSYLDTNINAAGLFSPVDAGFPDDGIIALGELNVPQIVYGKVNFQTLAKCRKLGAVANFEDMQHRDYTIRQG